MTPDSRDRREAAVRDALALLNSMVLSGEQHSERSQRVLRDAYAALAASQPSPSAVPEAPSEPRPSAGDIRDAEDIIDAHRDDNFGTAAAHAILSLRDEWDEYDAKIAALPPSAPEDIEGLARAYIRVRGAHNPTAEELDGDEEVRPCAWCRLAAEQHVEASRRLASSPVAPTEDFYEDGQRVMPDDGVGLHATPGIADLPALDEAWKAAEAALPEGWWMQRVAFNDRGDWHAVAHARGDYAHATGPTPAAALQALALRLATTTEETTDG